MSPVLTTFRVQARYWLHHRVQGTLALLGIALGVAVFIAVRMANTGALAAFAEGIEAFAGKATHHIYSPSGAGIPDAWYARVAMLPQVRVATPVLQGKVRVAGGSSLPLTVLGVDPIADTAFGTFDYLPPGDQRETEAPRAGLERFLRVRGGVVLPEALAGELRLRVGDPLPVMVRGREQTLWITGVFRPPPRNAALFARTVAVDISTFQEVFTRPGDLDEIGLVLSPGGDAAVEALLPSTLTLEPIGARAERVNRISRAFRLNLESLGLFALLVAAFLIYNTAMFSVVQREHSVAVLRCIGARTGAVFGALLMEAGLLGLAGGAIGVLAGRWLAVILLRSTSATLFEVILNTDAVPATAQLTAVPWVLGLGLGVVASIAGTLIPAVEGARVSPLSALRGLRGAGGVRFRIGLWSVAGMAFLTAAAAMLLTPSDSLPLGLAGATALVLGGALLSPAALWLASRILHRPLEVVCGVSGQLAARNLSRSISRTGMATASLMVALSLALAIEITVHSFRHTFELWLSQAITADLYIAPAVEGRGADFPQHLADALRGKPWARDVAELKSRRVVTRGREVLVVAVHPDVFARTTSLPMLDAVPADAVAALRKGDALVSETLAFPLGLHRGDRIPLPGLHGAEDVSIAAIVQNYSVPTGVIYLDIQRFTALFGAVPTQQAAVWLQPGADVAAVRDEIERLPDADRIRINPNATLKHEALRIFDRTFAITRLMGGLASFVAFVAVVSALLALLEERIRVLGYLRAIGVSRRRIGQSLALEAALLALVAGLLSWAVGYVMSAVLVFVVNRRAFGWTLQFFPGEGSYLQLLGLAVLAALLGSLYPIWRATRGSVVATIREE